MPSPAPTRTPRGNPLPCFWSSDAWGHAATQFAATRSDIQTTQAAWNPLATTRDMPGATDFNWVGVKNYRSLAQGIAASIGTLEYGYEVYRYGAIVEDLRRCADPYATAASIAASSWCPGCLDGMYVVGLIPKVAADLASYAAL